MLKYTTLKGIKFGIDMVYSLFEEDYFGCYGLNWRWTRSGAYCMRSEMMVGGLRWWWWRWREVDRFERYLELKGLGGMGVEGRGRNQGCLPGF